MANPLSPISPLITTEYAQTNAFLASLPTDALNNFIAAASGKIRRYCKRNFNSASYSQLFSGGLYPFDTFFLTEIPILEIDRLASNPTVVMNIQNTLTTIYSRATVRTTTTGLALYKVASGTPTTDTVTWAGNATVQAVANTINALGNGWIATPVSGYANYASADLQSQEGAWSALQGPGAGLVQYLELPLFGGTCSYPYGGIQNWTQSPGWMLDPDKGIIWGQFPPGNLNIRCDWTGGFAQIPDAVQEATLLTCVALWGAGRINPILKSEGALDYNYTANDKVRIPPDAARQLLSEFVDAAAQHV